MLSQVTPSYATIKISVSAADVLHGTIFRPASRTDIDLLPYFETAHSRRGPRHVCRHQRM